MNLFTNPYVINVGGIVGAGAGYGLMGQLLSINGKGPAVYSLSSSVIYLGLTAIFNNDSNLKDTVLKIISVVGGLYFTIYLDCKVSYNDSRNMNRVRNITFVDVLYLGGMRILTEVVLKLLTILESNQPTPFIRLPY